MKVELFFLIIFLCTTSLFFAGDFSRLKLPSADELSKWEEMTKECSIGELCDAFDRVDEWDKLGYLDNAIMYSTPEGRLSLIVGTNPVKMYLHRPGQREGESFEAVLSPDVIKEVRESREK